MAANKNLEDEEELTVIFFLFDPKIHLNFCCIQKSIFAVGYSLVEEQLYTVFMCLITLSGTGIFFLEMVSRKCSLKK